ncbi:MAG TPA: PilZ domain-containing protein [Myxococcaceae bacterium]|jgi:hypothetical protein|nr:PilZ domain-containing protein [Myxococcaceae bacterium]
MIQRPPASSRPPAKDTRKYPRADVRVKATLSVGNDKSRQFEATLNTRDISIGGIFFESTFFLKVGQVIDVELKLPPKNREVRARGRVVRVETRDERGQQAGGFAVTFDEFLDSSDVVLANYFMSEVLRGFVETYARKRKARFSSEEMDALVDVLASWELSRTTGDVKVWKAPSPR